MPSFLKGDVIRKNDRGIFKNFYKKPLSFAYTQHLPLRLADLLTLACTPPSLAVVKRGANFDKHQTKSISIFLQYYWVAPRVTISTSSSATITWAAVSASSRKPNLTSDVSDASCSMPNISVSTLGRITRAKICKHTLTAPRTSTI